MEETNFFWQGGRKIAVRKDNADITIQAESKDEVQKVAMRAGVSLNEMEPVSRGLFRATVLDERDAAVDRLRAQDTVVHHVYRDSGPQAGDSEYLITESFFVKFKPQTTEERILQYIRDEHLVVEKVLPDKTYLVRVTTDTGRNPIRTANKAAEQGDVEYAEPNLIRRLTKFAFIPPDELFAKQWHLHAPTAAANLAAGAGIFAPEAWDITRGTRDIVIAVADDGFDMTHPDFQGTGKLIASLNATLHGDENNGTIEWDANVAPRAGDYHGTPCLGVAAAEGNGTGVVGVAPGCAILPVRFPLAEMSDAHFIAMFNKISSLADVVSCSWGVGPANAPMSTPLKDAMAALAKTGGRRGKGLVFCIAAGNNNCPVQDLNNTQTYRSLRNGIIRNYSGPIDRWVAAHPDVITVSASTSRMTRSAYSSWGEQICVCAPSDNWDDLGQQSVAGLGIMTTDNEGAGPGSDFTEGSRFTGDFGGTSSATPTVAGVCALVLSANPALTGLEVRDILKATADKNLLLTSDTPVNKAGDFNAQGFSLWFGHGKVNAFTAVQRAAARVAEERVIDIRQQPSLPIPDAGVPILSKIDINADGRITALRIHVDIRHTYIGDLRVELLAPDGPGVVLHGNTGGSANDLVRTYSVQDTPALRPLLDRRIQGTWSLRVRDTARLDAGKLNGWRIAARVAL